MTRTWVAVGAVVVAAAVIGGGLYAMKSRAGKGGAAAMPAGFEPAEATEIVEAREVSWQATADLVGTVFALRSITVRNELAAAIRSVGFQSGDIVEKDQIILQQDDTTDRADLDAAKAAVRVAEANIVQTDTQVTLAEAELTRLTDVQSRAIAAVEIDRARAKLDSTKADRGRWVAEVDQAKAHVAQVEARLAKLTMRAPFRARAGMRTVHEGQFLKEGTDVVELQELTKTIYLDFAIPQQYAPRVKEGVTVMATAEMLGTDPVQIKVVAVDATVNYDTRNLRIRSIVENPKGILVPGMSVQVRVPLEEPRTYVVVPNLAVRRAAYATFVFTVAPDEKDSQTLRAHQRFVTLGQTVGEDVIVLQGLKSGERIAGAGSFKLREGAKVSPGAPAPTGQANAPGSGTAPATASAGSGG